MSIPQQLLVLASTFHQASILLFGNFIPALSSVKAVVRKDVEAYHQWSTYWLILHLYLTILSPVLHLTLHPVFQILAILWLSLPQYQGASLVYERIVNPWVDQYETKVDDAVDEAHRGVRKWIFSRLGVVAWMLIGEGGSLAQELFNIAIGFLGVDSTKSETQGEVPAMKPSDSTESLPPRHSVKEALRQSSSIEEAKDIGNHAFVPSVEFINDFLSILRQGLYVFANIDITDEATGVLTERSRKLCTFLYTEDGGGAFLLSPVEAERHELDKETSAPVRMPLGDLKPLRINGSQGLIFECVGSSGNKENFTNHISAVMVLSDESDRDILLNGLNACLPYILT